MQKRAKVASKIEEPIIPKHGEYPLTGDFIKVQIDDAPPEIANALARVAACESPYYALEVDSRHIVTDDMHMIVPELVKNIRIMPLRYGLTDDDINNTILRIDITNTTDDIMPITIGHLGYKNHKPEPLITYPNIVLIYLESGKRLEILEIRIVRGTGLDHNGQHAATRFFPGAHHVSKPAVLPTTARRNFSQDGSMMNTCCRSNVIEFGLKAICPGAKVLDLVMASACREIVRRLAALLQLTVNKDAQSLTLIGRTCTLIGHETNTIAKILDRMTTEFYPNVESVTTSIKYPDMNFEYRIKDENSYEIMKDVFNQCINLYTDLESQFR